MEHMLWLDQAEICSRPSLKSVRKSNGKWDKPRAPFCIEDKRDKITVLQWFMVRDKSDKIY